MHLPKKTALVACVEDGCVSASSPVRPRPVRSHGIIIQIEACRNARGTRRHLQHEDALGHGIKKPLRYALEPPNGLMAMGRVVPVAGATLPLGERLDRKKFVRTGKPLRVLAQGACRYR